VSLSIFEFEGNPCDIFIEEAEMPVKKKPRTVVDAPQLIT
jgi:hypothetical protein